MQESAGEGKLEGDSPQGGERPCRNDAETIESIEQCQSSVETALLETR